MYLSGEFRDRAAVTRALRELQANGFATDALDVYSDEPLELPHDVLARPSRMSFMAVSGAVLLGLLTIGFVYYTQYNYPLITGGMPLFSFWATGVVFYELTMLGAILTTFGWFLFESGILLRKGRAPVPAMASGAIYIRVRCGENQKAAAGETLTAAGAEGVTELGERA